MICSKLVDRCRFAMWLAPAVLAFVLDGLSSPCSRFPGFSHMHHLLTLSQLSEDGVARLRWSDVRR